MSEEHLPDRRKHGYLELEAKLEQHTEEVQKRLLKFFVGELNTHVDKLERRLERFFTKALFAFAILGFTSAGSLLGFGLVLKNEARISNNIQQQRYDTIMENCTEQNDQHDRANARAEALYSRDDATLKAVKLLIDELQPYEPDCEAFTERRVKGIR